jgi:hypothetical protein
LVVAAKGIWPTCPLLVDTEEEETNRLLISYIRMLVEYNDIT